MVLTPKAIRKARILREKKFKELNKWEGKFEKAAKTVRKLKSELEDID